VESVRTSHDGCRYHVDGLYWVAAAVIVSFVKAISDAWVLLVEINR
jgi:hypothetical protein